MSAHVGSIAEAMVRHPPVIGKIKVGEKILTPKASNNPVAERLYTEEIGKGSSFRLIDEKLRKLGIENALMPVNTEYFTTNSETFDDPRMMEVLLSMYGEDRGEGRHLYNFPLVLPYDDILQNMPHRFASYRASGLNYFSEYDDQGNRLCMKYAEPVKTLQSTRVVKFFGARPKEVRQDEFIDGYCNVENCPQFQSKKCSLKLDLFCMIPNIKGAGVIQIQSQSVVSMLQWFSTLSLVKSTRGSLRNVEFRLRKKFLQIPYTDDQGKAQKSWQWITVLDAAIDLPKLVSEKQQNQPAPVQTVVALLEGSDERYKKLQTYLQSIRQNNELDRLSKGHKSLKATLAYLNVELSAFIKYAEALHGVEWANDVEIVDNLLSFVSTRTEAEMRALIN